ncbi:MAG: DUF3750 domain-containing protein [Bdellovibrionales bacterium]|nr:DUF3750 domain-containing protein [Bdellovibrionales bacterium]
MGIAPLASELDDHIVQIYHARAFSWRGYFGVHPWIAWKKASDDQYTVAQVISWNLRRNGSAVDVSKDLPDRKWYDSSPHIIFEARGEKAKKIIDQLPSLIESYPYKSVYKVWPGPNSNTFIGYLIRNIDELDIELPANAIGKDYSDDFLLSTASGTGLTFSTYGLFGLTLGLGEGLEVNLLGLHFGIDFWTPALKLPLVGRVGFPDQGF